MQKLTFSILSSGIITDQEKLKQHEKNVEAFRHGDGPVLQQALVGYIFFRLNKISSDLCFVKID